MRTKTEKAINLFESGCLKEALSIFRTFRIGFTKEDTDSMISKSVEIITEKYLSNQKV